MSRVSVPGTKPNRACVNTTSTRGALALSSPPKKLYSARTTVTLFHPQKPLSILKALYPDSRINFHRTLLSLVAILFRNLKLSFFLSLGPLSPLSCRLYRNFPIRYFSHSPLPFRDNSHPPLALVANNRHTYISRVAVQLKIFFFSFSFFFFWRGALSVDIIPLARAVCLPLLPQRKG